MKTLNFITIFLVLFVVLIGCQSNIGPCVHNYEEPILTIHSVNSSENGNEINLIKIFDVKIDSMSRTPGSLTNEISNNITVDDSLLICTVPCGFGTEEGVYEISVSADEYRDLTLSTLAKYDQLKGGCPSSSSGGHSISFSLYPK